MKITALESVRLSAHPNLLWVRVHTDEGLTGLGETYFGAASAEADLHERIAPLLLGEDASRIDYLNRRMQPYVGFAGTGAEIRALSAVDVALWDIAGKAKGQPVCDLFGGRVRAEIAVYNTCAGPSYVSKTSAVRPENFGLPAGKRRGFEDLDAFLHRADELAAELMEMGIFSMKIWPFDLAAGAAAGLEISPADLKAALVPFEKVRAAHGTRMRLKAELHGLWSLAAAKEICAALEPLAMDWVEDPIWMDHVGQLPALAAHTRAPLAGGETLGGIGQVAALMDTRAIATPIVDVTWGGGITFGRRCAALAEERGLPIAFHDCSGPITLSASTHLALAVRNVREQEIARGMYYGWYAELVDQPSPVKNGAITVPPGAGLGIALQPGLEKRSDATVRRTGL
ncbi:MAG TPA: mandelate racemase/muconate lactonizing enzyme family protein [Burkholderiales bacterium]|nr:mandelate racemase/muconate lactonizing enzyme family protein [Burkholderiales bacterium]